MSLIAQTSRARHNGRVIIVSAHGDALGDPGAIGWAWVDHTGGMFDSGGAAHGTENSAHLTAILHAITANPGTEPLFVESNSQHAIRVVTDWLTPWKTQGWRTSTQQEVPDIDLVRALDTALESRLGPVRFRHVRGHVDSSFHQRARRLAELAAADWLAGRGELDGFLIASMPPVVSSGIDTSSVSSQGELMPQPSGIPAASSRTSHQVFQASASSHKPHNASPPWESTPLF